MQVFNTEHAESQRTQREEGNSLCILCDSVVKSFLPYTQKARA